MNVISSVILNPAVISVILLCVLCLKKINVLLAIIISSIAAGLFSHMDIKSIMDIFISGMGGNSETALSYILLGTFAATMAHSGFTLVISNKIKHILAEKKMLLFAVLCLIAMASQNIIPIHIAFIPIVIPPILNMMNSMKIDRRAVSCVLAFGLKMPYIVIPAGYGLIFQNLIADNMIQNGVNGVARGNIWQYTAILGVGMFAALLIAVFISYRKPRIYKISTDLNCPEAVNEKFKVEHLLIILAALATFVVQIMTKSLPLGAMVGLGVMFSCKVLSKDNMDHMMNEGIYLMGYVAFVMLVAAGFANVLTGTNSIEKLVTAILPVIPDNIILTALILLIIGLFITMGIGTSFGTIPIISVLFVPICIKVGFNPAQIVILVAAAAALGDAGSPSSDTTLGPTSGLNADGQHNHIYDTCIPTFLHYNTALILFALVGIWLYR